MGVLKYALAGAVKGGADTALGLEKEAREQSIWEARQKRLQEAELDKEERNKEWYKEKLKIDNEAKVEGAEAMIPVETKKAEAVGKVNDTFAQRAEQRRLQSQKELEQMKRGKPVTVSDGSALVNPETGEVLYENEKDKSGAQSGYLGYKDRNQLEGKLLAAAKFVLGFSEQTGWTNDGDKAKAAKMIKEAEDLMMRKHNEGDPISASRAVAEVSQGKEAGFIDKKVGDAIERFAQNRAERAIGEEFGLTDKIGALFTGEYSEAEQAAAEKAERLKTQYMIEARRAYNRAKQMIERYKNQPEVRAEVIRKLREKGIPTEGL